MQEDLPHCCTRYTFIVMLLPLFASIMASAIILGTKDGFYAPLNRSLYLTEKVLFCSLLNHVFFTLYLAYLHLCGARCKETLVRALIGISLASVSLSCVDVTMTWSIDMADIKSDLQVIVLLAILSDAYQCAILCTIGIYYRFPTLVVRPEPYVPFPGENA